MKKRIESGDEPILEPDLTIIDAHHHLLDGPALRYMLDDYLADASAGHKIVASVFVEAGASYRTEGPAINAPLGEIEFAAEAGAMSDSGDHGKCHACAAIVGHADLRFGDEVAEMLDRSLSIAPARVRGVRQTTMEHPSEAAMLSMARRPQPGILAHPSFRVGFRHLAPRGLSFDAAVFHNQLPDIAALADAFPSTTIVLNHLGMAMAMGLDQADKAEVRIAWDRGLRDLALRSNVVCKLSGLGLPSWGFGFEHRAHPVGYLELAAAGRPYIRTAVEAFGTDRCMMGSNFPSDGSSCGFVSAWNAMKHVTQNFTAREKEALFARTAARVYRMRA